MSKNNIENIISAIQSVTGVIPSGCFYTPRQWRDRGEDYGRNSLLIVTHDGGTHAPYFSWEYDYHKGIEQLQEELGKLGLYAEQCTSWYSAIYEA